MAEAKSPFYQANRTFGSDSLPTISMGLDSVRAYQFEIFFKLPPFSPTLETDAGSKLTLAAKQVSQVGMTIEDIEVHRVNDKVFYPGKATPEELTVTFDNFYQENGRVAEVLWQWFSWIYDPMSGKLTEKSTGNTSNWKSQSFVIVHLDAQGQPKTETRLYGVYPKSWKTAEFNYATNEFHTIEMTFRYDFMEHVDRGTGVGNAII